MAKLVNLSTSVLLALMLLPSSAFAATFNGADVNASFRFPFIDSVFLDYGSAVVGDGIEYSNLNVDNVIFFDIDIDDTSITVNFDPTGSFFTNPEFNGVFFTGLGTELSSLSVATVVAIGFDFQASDVLFDPTGFGFNFRGDSFLDGGSVTVSFDRGVSTVPLPGALPLLLTALAGFGVLRLRRRAV